MKTVKLSDLSLRALSQTRAISFKEKIEIARTLDRLGLDVIELPPIADARADVLVNKTVASLAANSAVSAACALSEEGIEEAWTSVKDARRPALHITVPVSVVQMEYICHKKAPAVLELIKALTAKARYYCEQVEVTLADATRAEKAFLYQAAEAAIAAGAGTVTFGDSAGLMDGAQCAQFLADLFANVNTLNTVDVGMELSDELGMAVACAAAAVQSGVTLLKCAVSPMNTLTLEGFEKYVRLRGENAGVRINLRSTELGRAAQQLQFMLQTQRSSGSPFDSGVSQADQSACLSADDDISELIKMVRQMGYELSEDDYAKVYDAFRRIAVQKHFVGARELEAIIATTAFQVPSTYRIGGYTITTGSAVSAMATVALEKDGQQLRGVSVGDGPIDAAFIAIEQCIGHHYELDDFQIQTVTQGREAMGSALVKLRSGGKLYSGTGISTDIIGASIRAYISALNKIVYEEV